MNNQKSSTRLNLTIIFFTSILPITILSIIFFVQLSDYNMYELEIKAIESEAEKFEGSSHEVSRFVHMPTDEVIAFTDIFSDEFQLIELQPETQSIENRYSIDSDIFEQLLVTYQPDGIVFAAKGNGDYLNLYSYQYGSEPKKIDHQPISSNTFLFQTAIVFNNQIYFVSTDEANDYVALKTIGDQVEIINFSQSKEVPNVTGIEFYNFSSSDVAYPLVKITTYDNTEYYFDLYDTTNEDFLTFNDESSIEIESELLTLYHETEIPLLTGEDVTIEDELFYPELFSLTEDLALVIGGTGVRDVDPISGYIIESTIGNVIKAYEQSDIWKEYNDSEFQIQFDESSNKLFVSGNNYAGKIDLDNDNISYYDQYDYEVALTNHKDSLLQERDQLIEEGTAFTLERMVDFIKNDTGPIVLVVNSIAFAIFPFIMVLSFLSRRRRARNELERIYENGGRRTAGTIVSFRETGITINDRPQVELTIKFDHNGDELIRKAKINVSILTPPRVGNLINVIYDPVRNKLYILNNNEELEEKSL